MIRTSENPVILFDGYCHLCSGVVRFILRRDPKGRFRFDALQSESGQALLEAYRVPPEIGDSIVLLDENGASMESTAALHIHRRLRWPWPLFYVFVLVPSSIRNAVYGGLQGIGMAGLERWRLVLCRRLSCGRGFRG